MLFYGWTVAHESPKEFGIGTHLVDRRQSVFDCKQWRISAGVGSARERKRFRNSPPSCRQRPSLRPQDLARRNFRRGCQSRRRPQWLSLTRGGCEGLAEVRMPIFFTSGKTRRTMSSVLAVRSSNILATPVMLPPGRAGAGPGAALYNVISGTGANTVDGTTAERAPGSPREPNDSAICRPPTLIRSQSPSARAARAT